MTAHTTPTDRRVHLLRFGQVEGQRDLSRDQVNKLIFHYRCAGQVIPDFQFKPGFLYNTTRAIAARINQNYDAWPSDQLKKYYRTFIGKPIFVNHNNEDPDLARGVVVAARYIEGKGGDNYVEVVQEVDAKAYPKLAHEIRSGGLDGVSMGVEAGFTICSVCDNKATDLHDMCDHVKHHKGSTMRHVKTGKKTLVYEKCYKLGFFELSYVFDPADETALVSRVIMAHNKQAEGYNHPPTPRRDPKWNRPRNKSLNDTKRRWVTDAEPGDSPDVDLSEPDPFDPESYRVAASDQMDQQWMDSPHGAMLNLDGGHFLRTRGPGKGGQYEWQHDQAHPDTVDYKTVNHGVARDHDEAKGHAWSSYQAAMDADRLGAGDWDPNEDLRALYGHRTAEYVDNSYRTQRGNTMPTYDKGKAVMDARGAPQGRTLDYGAGLGHSSASYGFDTFEPNPQGGFLPTYGYPDDIPDASYDRVHNHNVLNVVPPDVRNHIVGEIGRVMKPGGHAVISTRGPEVLKAKNGVPADEPGAVRVNPDTPRETYQKGFTPKELHSYVSGQLGPGYTVSPAKVGPAGVHVVRHAPTPTKSVKPRKKSSRWVNSYYGETVAPEDIDTLRSESEDDTDDFHHWVASPPELRKPNMDQSQRLDQAQENEGLDADRNVENIEEQAAPAPADPSGEEIGNEGSPFMDEEPENEDEPVMPINPPQTKSSRWLLKENRMARYHYAEDEGYDGDEGYDEDEGSDDSHYEEGGDDGGDEGGYPEDEGGDDFGDDFGGGDDFGADPYADPSQGGAPGDEGPADLDDVHQLLDEAASAIDEYKTNVDEGGTGDDSLGDEFDDGSGGFDDGSDPYAADDGGGEDPYADPNAQGDDQDLPPWLAQANRSPVKGRRARRNSRGGNMRTTLASRNPGARHFTADDGHTDGGPYGVDDSQGEQEDIFISQVPGAEAVAAPTPGDGTISNSPGNLVARRRKAKRPQFDPAHYQRLADTVASMPVAQRKTVAQEMVRAFTADNKAFNAVTFYKEAGVPMVKKGSRYFFAEDLTDPDKVNPELSGTDADVKSGDFESLALDNVETQPKDASVHAFRQFDAWLKKVTGRNAREHGNANYISRAAASYCNQYGNQRTAALNSLFPTLEYVLREARKIEGRTAAMNRYAEDKSLEVAAPQDRIDVEAPVKNVTDAQAQASQFDLGDFAHNAGDQIADPELDVVDGNAGTWAPDKGKESSVKLASGTEAMRCAEAYVAAMPNTYRPEDRWRLASMFETLRQPYVRREIRLLEAVLADRKTHTARNKVAAVGSRGTNGIPSGLGSRRTASSGQIKNAAANPETDSFVLFM